MGLNTIEKDLKASLDELRRLNPNIGGRRNSDILASSGKRPHRLQKVLVANRAEIAKRFFLALHEEGIPSVAVVTDVDKEQSWYEFAGEVVFIGDRHNYSNIPVIIAAAELSSANAIYPGYGFLSESAEFVQAIDAASRITGRRIIFMGPDYKTMSQVGNKINARILARKHGIPLFESSDILTESDKARAFREAGRIGYPVMVKLTSGGGGRGIYPVFRESELERAIDSCCRIGREVHNDASFYIEKYLTKPTHIEVQIFNGWAIGIRKCAVQRRNQKIIEESGNLFFDNSLSASLLGAAEKIAHISGYSRNSGAGTVEFLIDGDTGNFGFMEVNTRLQVEYAVTDQSLGIDLAKWQILFFDGRENEITGFDALRGHISKSDHSIECRIYAEDPENDYLPSPGTILEIDLPAFNGIRCDFGYNKGDNIMPMYDPMIGKIIANGATRNEALIRMDRALQEFYLRGIKTNTNQLIRIIRHPGFIRGDYTNNLLLENPELNFHEAAGDETSYTNRRSVKHIIFGGFAEHIRLLYQTVGDFMVIAHVDGIINAKASRLPAGYSLEYRGLKYDLVYIQTGLNSFYAFINGKYNGRIILNTFNDRCDDIQLIFGNSSYRIRIDRQAGNIVLRMRDESGKINYYRMHISAEGIEEEDDTGVIYSPFQGNFVGFCRDDLKIGSVVKAGEPLIILSSMKMETVINSPVGGTIVYLIGNGDSSGLLKSKRPDGSIVPVNLQEGDKLIVIERDKNEHADIAQPRQNYASPAMPAPGDETQEILMAPDFVDRLMENPAKHLSALTELLYALMQGFIEHQGIIDKIESSIGKIPDSVWNECMEENLSRKINDIILQYAGIKKLFAPVAYEDGVSLPEELGRFVLHWNNPQAGISPEFSSVITPLLDSYGASGAGNRSEMKKMQIHYVFLLLKRSYGICLDHPDIIKCLTHIAVGRGAINDTFNTLYMLFEQEQYELDDSLSMYIKKIMGGNFPKVGMKPYYADEAADTGGIPDDYETAEGLLPHRCLESFKRSEETLLPADLQAPFTDEIGRRMEILQREFNVKRLYSGFTDVFIYHLQNKKDELDRRFAVIACVRSIPASDKNIENLGDAMLRCGWVVSAYHQAVKGGENWIEIITADYTASWDIPDGDAGFIDYDKLKEICLSASEFLDDKSAARGIIDIDVQYCKNAGRLRKHVVFYIKDNSVALDMLFDSDRRNPYFNSEKFSITTQRLFNGDKWPIELWAAECFDPGTMIEIKINSIDGEKGHTGEDKLSIKPVGAKIFQGKIQGKDACFYMKDSRISGGSTGNREGLKYIAAAYISYLKNWPLYVWNDSAGANIIEGVVSLNRGAEGFMMNALISENVDYKTFRHYVENISNPELKSLLSEVDLLLNLNDIEPHKAERSAGLVAVGIGSSAGLDVYGSSQAVIQILLDSPSSYRVLTGSNVIRSVIGEDISNYDIGGAKILGKWTGIVDIVASDKIQLVSSIRGLHGLFHTCEALSGIRRKPAAALNAGKGASASEMLVFTESVIRNNVDDGMFWQYKSGYYASGALIGGFAKLGGRRALILGPRTHSGIRSAASIIKARELLKMARRSSSCEILIFGRKWQDNPDYHENINMREWMDFMDDVQRESVLRIHIITDVSGLQCFYINNSADAVIFIKDKDISQSDKAFAARNSTFMADSFEEAFDLSMNIIKLVRPVNTPRGFELPQGSPVIPADTSQPYDMINSVITPVFDLGSFVEFYSEMNNPLSGPNLITGLAELEGRTVGIIADQPMYKGGAADAPGTEKFRVFTDFLNRKDIPLFMLSNSSGFVPGSRQERYRIQAIGAYSLDVNILGRIPVVSVVLNQNYGGRLIQAFNKFLRPGIAYIALESAVMAVIGVTPAFDLLHGAHYNQMLAKGETEKAGEMRNNFYRDYLEKSKACNNSLSTGLVDWTIKDISDLRGHFIKALELAIQRCNDAFGEAAKRF